MSLSTLHPTPLLFLPFAPASLPPSFSSQTNVPPLSLFTQVYGSITAITKTYPYGSPVRTSVIVAYGRTTTPMFIAAVCLSFVCILAGLAMPNTYLGKVSSFSFSLFSFFRPSVRSC